MCPDGCTVFCQGMIDDHCIHSKKTHDENIKCSIQNAQTKKGYCPLDDGIQQSYNQRTPGPVMQRFRLHQYCNQPLEPNLYNENFGTWFERVLGRTFPNPYKGFMPGALFAVSNSRILSKPKEFYEKLLLELKTPNPEVAHFFERSWRYIFEDD